MIIGDTPRLLATSLGLQLRRRWQSELASMLSTVVMGSVRLLNLAAARSSLALPSQTTHLQEWNERPIEIGL